MRSHRVQTWQWMSYISIRHISQWLQRSRSFCVALLNPVVTPPTGTSHNRHSAAIRIWTPSWDSTAVKLGVIMAYSVCPQTAFNPFGWVFTWVSLCLYLLIGMYCMCGRFWWNPWTMQHSTPADFAGCFVLLDAILYHERYDQCFCFCRCAD